MKKTFGRQFGNILMMLGLRRRPTFLQRNGRFLAPVGGVIPTLAWLAYHNRDRIKSLYQTRVAPKLHRGTTTGRAQPYQSAAI